MCLISKFFSSLSYGHIHDKIQFLLVWIYIPNPSYVTSHQGCHRGRVEMHRRKEVPF